MSTMRCPACTGPMQQTAANRYRCEFCLTEIEIAVAPAIPAAAPTDTFSPATALQPTSQPPTPIPVPDSAQSASAAPEPASSLLSPTPAPNAAAAFDPGRLWIATGSERIYLLAKNLNRHGLVAGATGTGKTVTIKVLAEALSDIGVPVFMADIKGDVSGLCQPGEPNPKVEERVTSMGIEGFAYRGYPVRFFDVFGENGIPVRATISGLGPQMMARILGLNETQTGILHIIFRIADDNGMLLLDLKDLRAMALYVGEHAKDFITTYGNITAQSIGAIQRSLLTLEAHGAESFFGEPALQLSDWLVQDTDGRGMINILDCVRLFQSPLLYSTFLLWMLSELYELLPEVGDLDKPKMVFFFDEAHLLFKDTPKALLQKIEQVVRLIRSKAVGIYFITQSPADIPDTILAQLGNKIQHALRAYTPKDQKAVKAAAASYRPNPAFNAEKTLSELATGEALLSVLDEKGAPLMVQRAFILPPKTDMGAASPSRIAELTKNCPLYSKYGQAIDRDSAFEILERMRLQQQSSILSGQQPQAKRQAQPRTSTRPTNAVDRAMNSAVSSAANTVGREVGRSLIRGILGNIKK